MLRRGKTASIALFAAVLVVIPQHARAQQALHTRNVVLVTIDGLRWQELFGGVDSVLLRDRRFVPDTAATRSRFWRTGREQRRATLLPFVWSTLHNAGQLYGDREAGSQVDITNTHRFSYPGYNEILTGFADPRIDSNDKIPNPNRTVLEVINGLPQFKGRVAMFGSWDVFPYIVNEERSGVPVNAGFELATGALTPTESLLNELQAQAPVLWSSVRLDMFTHNFAKQYILRERPRLVHIAYGEADDFAHDGRYDFYLDAVQRTDAFLRDLWTTLENTPGYGGATTMIVIGDHGRGNGDQWRGHGGGYEGSQHIWLMAVGPDTPARGLVSTQKPVLQNQIAGTIARLLGVEYTSTQPVGAPVATLFVDAR